MSPSSSSLLLYFVYMESLIIRIDSYYLSPNRFNLNDGQIFCADHCNSNLASIHSSYDHKYINMIARNMNIYSSVGNNDNIWIGLNNLNWIDKTSFDFVAPWNIHEPSGISSSVAYTFSNISNQYVWMHQNNLTKSRVLCNHCDGVLNKYILLQNKSTNFTASDIYCNNQIKTHLASIHSERDQNEANTIINAVNSIFDIYIGLSDQSTDTGTMSFAWSDNSTLDFGKNTTGGIYPWKGGEPNNSGGNERCVLLWNDDNGKWNDAECVATDNLFLCNLQSEICNNYTYWSILNGNMTKNECYSVIITDDFKGFISNKQWINNNKLLVIDYLFAVNTLNKRGSTGLILYSLNNLIDFYFIGVTKLDDSPDWIVLYIEKYVADKWDILDFVTLSQFALDIYYTLTIQIQNGSAFKIIVNEMEYIDFIDNDTIRGVDGIMSGYIGIMNVNSTITAKSLFVSGSVLYINATLEPTQSPSISPTIIETEKPSYGVSVSVSFQYELNNNTNITNIVITEILTNIIHSQIINITYQICVDSIDDYDIKIANYDRNKMLINGTIYLCDAYSQNILSVQLNSSLKTEFIEAVQNKYILQVKDISVDIDIGIIDKEVFILSTTPFPILQTTKNDEQSNEKNNTLWIIVCIVIFMVILGICAVLLWRIRTRKKNKMQTELEKYRIETEMVHSNDEDKTGSIMNGKQSDTVHDEPDSLQENDEEMYITTQNETTQGNVNEDELYITTQNETTQGNNNSNITKTDDGNV